MRSCLVFCQHSPFMRRSYTYVLAALLGIALVLHALTQFIDQDEEQYVSAAYFAQNLTLYLDFLSLQPPVYPLILSKLFSLFSDSSKFLIARLLSGVLAISTVVVFFNLAARRRADVQREQFLLKLA